MTDTKEVLNLLQEHIFKNIVKVGQNYFLQIEGIPQGSSLSALLCQIYYEHVDQIFFQDLIFPEDDDKSDSLLMRYIDDSLFVSTNLDHAKEYATR